MKIYLRRTIEEHWTLEVDDQLIEHLKSTQPGIEHQGDDDAFATTVFNYFRRYASVLQDNSPHPLSPGATLTRGHLKPMGGEDIGMLASGPGGADEDDITQSGEAPDRMWERDPNFGAEDSIMIRIDPSDLPDPS